MYCSIMKDMLIEAWKIHANPNFALKPEGAMRSKKRKTSEEPVFSKILFLYFIHILLYFAKLYFYFINLKYY